MTGVRARVVALLFALVLVNYVDRGAMSFAASAIVGEYGLDRAAWGQVLGTFGYGYMIGALAGGALSDRFGPRRVWLAAGLAWSALEAATVVAGDAGVAVAGSALVGFGAARALFGLAEGPAYSLLNKSLAAWATPEERAWLVSVGLLSTPLGAMITAPVSVGLLTLTGSWRATFLVLGAAGIGLIALFAAVFADRPEDHPGVGADELARLRPVQGEPAAASDAPAPAWWVFFGSRTLVANAVGYFAFLYVTFLLLTWTPKYLQDAFGFDLAALGFLAAIPWSGAAVTVLVGGRLSDAILARTGSRRLARSGLASASLLCTSGCFLAVAGAESPEAAIGWMTLGNAFNALPNAVYWTVVLETAPPARVGTWSGMTHFLANTATVLAPTLTGWLTASYGYPAAFAAAGAATALGVVAMALVRPGVLREPG